MKSYRVTIKDIVSWTTIIPADDAIDAENQAWELFQITPDRGALFETDDETTVQVEEVSQ